MTEVKANPHNLSDSELELLETLDTSSSIVFLSSKDSHAKYDFLKAFLLEQTEKGKTLVFRAREKKPVIEYLRKIGLSDFVLDLRKDTQITRDQIGHFSNKDRNYQIESIKANFLYKKSLSRLEEVREKYNEEIFGTYPRLKVAELFYLSKKRGSTFKLDLDVSSRNYRYDQKEFWQLRKKIEKAAKYYRSSFSFLRTSDVFAKDIYRDFHLAANQEIVFKYLQKFIADAEDLCKGYRTVFEQIREQLLGDYKHMSVD